MIEVLLLDLDNTLVDRDAAVLAWLRDVVPDHPERAGTIHALMASEAGGNGRGSAFYQQLGESLFVSAQVARRRFFAEMPAFARLKSDADALLRAFRGPTVVVTNGHGSVQRAKLVAAGLVGRIDHVLISEECGVRKPDAAIFRAALERAGCRAEAALMVGDNPHTDIAGARAAGVPAVFVRSPWFEAPGGVPSVALLTEVSW